MKTLSVSLPGRSYDILIGSGLLAQAGQHLRPVLPRARKLFVVTDSNVGPHLPLHAGTRLGALWI